jgi:site-specific recombinase XerD
MKPTDFAQYLSEFLTQYLPKQKNVSKNTLYSYRDTFKLLINYCQSVKMIPVERIALNILSSELIIGFLSWLEVERKCSIATRNQRLAAIHSFFLYVQSEEPAGIFHFQKISAIPSKRSPKPTVEYLTAEAIKLLLAQPDKATTKGRRDLTLLSTLYDSGARVQELIDLQVCCVTLQNGLNIITLTGKGNKIRRVPITTNTANLLQSYLIERCLNQPGKNERLLFANNRHQKLTKEGIAYIISKYVTLARQTATIIPTRVNAHMFRHSKAMHLLQAGVNLIYIRDFLGHVDLRTTEIYARIDIEMKRKVIVNAYPDLVDSNLPDWNKDQALLKWLSELK